MENKNIQSQELELICQLLDLVNSKEEFVYLIAEKTRLSFSSLLLQRRCSKW
jgi:hypothetical protein